VPGKAAQQHVHRRLGGEGREEDRAAPRGFRVGVGQPGRERRRAGVDQEADQDQPVRETNRLHAREGGARRSATTWPVMPANRMTPPAGGSSRSAGWPPTALRAGAPQHQRRADGHQFPEHEDRDQVAGQRDADRRPGIEEGRRHSPAGSSGAARTGRRKAPSARRWWRTGATACRPAAARACSRATAPATLGRRAAATPAPAQQRRQDAGIARAAAQAGSSRRRRSGPVRGGRRDATHSSSSSLRRSRCRAALEQHASALAPTIIAAQVMKPYRR
jgi:hypothetical protein